MVEADQVRNILRQFEDKRITTSRMGREILHVADRLRDGRQSALRQLLVRLGHRFIALSERSIYDDVAGEIRSAVDELHDEILIAFDGESEPQD